MIRKINIQLFFLFLMVGLCASCIEEYKLPSSASEATKEELVIQGRILSGENSVIYISKTSPFGNGKGHGKSIKTATVSIIGQNGYESEIATYDNQQSHYLINTMQLPQNTLYAVKVLLDGETYQSEFQELQTSPEIDEITYKENVDGISIHVSTHDSEDGRRAYMWTYEEDWEFHADFDFTNATGVVLYNKNIYPVEDRSNPYLYCWGHQESGNIHIYSTENLKENAVKEHELFRIPINDIRISYIYSILVKQWSLNDKAYNYFKTLKLYTENTGGLFAPLPAEVKGNVFCSSNPNITVRGYVLAATVVEKRIFIYEKDFNQLVSEYENCLWLMAEQGGLYWKESWLESMQAGNSVILTENGNLDLSSKLYHRECFDCRITKGATKKRPDFWPNNHE